MNKRVIPSRNRREVRAMFNDIAPKYDLLNHVLSLSIDKLWRRNTVKVVAKSSPVKILDMATGTADLAIAMAKRIPCAEITGADLSEQMLSVARQKIEANSLDSRISLVQCEAEQIPLPTESVDVATVAFGVRNFENREQGLRELCRVIKPGGRLVVLEFSTPSSPLVRWVYNIYSHYILPFIGGLVSKNRAAYVYLPSSVDTFPRAKEFSQMLCQCGFSKVKASSQSFGIAYIHEATKAGAEVVGTNAVQR